MSKKSFSIELPADAVEISEAFGISDGFTREIFNMENPQFENILYITGESGSGKSVMMREFFTETIAEFPVDEPIFRIVDEDLNESLRWLSYVGLSDALLYPLTYMQLSDSQRSRFRLLMSAKENDLVVVDEFLSTLDRETAQAVAYCFQKMIRKLDKKAVVVTAHDDLENYLLPDLVIKGKAFPSRFESYRRGGLGNPYKDITYRYGTKEEYKQSTLGDLHYRGKYTGGVKEILFAEYQGRDIGVLLSINLIGKPGRKISRLVVHPTFRGIGVGRGLVEKYIKDYPNTEVIAVMAKYNPVFERAGMIRVENSVIKPARGLVKGLVASGFDENKWHSISYCLEFCQDIEHRKIVAEYANYANKIVQPGGAKLTTEEIAEKMVNEPFTCGRALFQLRRKEYAKYKTKERIESNERMV